MTLTTQACGRETQKCFCANECTGMHCICTYTSLYIVICKFNYAFCAFHWIITDIHRAVHALGGHQTSEMCLWIFKIPSCICCGNVWVCEVKYMYKQLIPGDCQAKDGSGYTPLRRWERGAFAFKRQAKFMILHVGVHIHQCIWMNFLCTLQNGCCHVHILILTPCCTHIMGYQRVLQTPVRDLWFCFTAELVCRYGRHTVAAHLPL